MRNLFYSLLQETFPERNIEPSDVISKLSLPNTAIQSDASRRNTSSIHNQLSNKRKRNDEPFHEGKSKQRTLSMDDMVSIS